MRTSRAERTGIARNARPAERKSVYRRQFTRGDTSQGRIVTSQTDLSGPLLGPRWHHPHSLALHHYLVPYLALRSPCDENLDHKSGSCRLPRRTWCITRTVRSSAGDFCGGSALGLGLVSRLELLEPLGRKEAGHLLGFTTNSACRHALRTNQCHDSKREAGNSITA